MYQLNFLTFLSRPFFKEQLFFLNILPDKPLSF